MNTKELRKALKKVRDPLGRKFTMASRKETSRLRAWVVKVTTELGHPEAFVTDESQVSDFRWGKKTLCGVTVTPDTKIIDIARKLRHLHSLKG